MELAVEYFIAILDLYYYLREVKVMTKIIAFQNILALVDTICVFVSLPRDPI